MRGANNYLLIKKITLFRTDELKILGFRKFENLYQFTKTQKKNITFLNEEITATETPLLALFGVIRDFVRNAQYVSYKVSITISVYWNSKSQNLNKEI